VVDLNSNIQSWAINTKATWRGIGMPEFLAKIGIDFVEYFVKSIDEHSHHSNPYVDSVWEIWPHSSIPSGVLHCYPKKVEADGVIWEEWFLLDGEIHHHILSNKSFAGAIGIWVPEQGDTDHPAEILNYSWHYEISDDLRPSRFIRESS
jgi:hypothetical protein